METRHAEYVEYYRARMRKYENNPMYVNSYQTEKAIYEAIASCSTLDELKGKLEAGDLTLKNAVALVKDQETARLSLYEEIREPIKAKYCRMILEAIEKVRTVAELTETVSRIGVAQNLEESVDGFGGDFYFDWTWLENFEVAAYAEVPPRWRQEAEKNKQEIVASSRDLFYRVRLPRAREWDPGWTMNHALVWEDRHRRKIPVPDATIARRIDLHRWVLGV